MAAKKELARRIVQDFHGEPAAKQAEENWAKQFQKDEVPEDVETVEVSLSEIEQKASPNSQGSNERPVIRIERLLHKAGLAESANDAKRKV